MTISSPSSRWDGAAPVEPALDDLQRKQDELFRRLADGFDSRRGVLLWCHDVSVRTLGQVGDEWFADLLGNRYQLTALLDDAEVRGRASETLTEDRRAELERAVLSDDTLVEACRAGMQVLARQAAEYVDSDAPIDASSQTFLAMRPAVDDLAGRQRRVLERALGRGGHAPLNDRADVREWVRDVIRATKGSDEGFGQRALWSPYWLHSLRGDPSSATLHLLLADELMAPMNASLRRTATAATEQANDETTTHGAWET